MHGRRVSACVSCYQHEVNVKLVRTLPAVTRSRVERKLSKPLTKHKQMSGSTFRLHFVFGYNVTFMLKYTNVFKASTFLRQIYSKEIHKDI